MKLIIETRKQNGVKMGLFKCECGVEIERSLSNGRKQKSCKKCGNKSIAEKNKINQTKHGGKGTRLYRIWSGMKDRCYNSNSKDFSRYGKIGVIVCIEWRDSFEKFRTWSMENGYEDTLSIDKDILSKKLGIVPPIYSPATCTWATTTEQGRNQKTTVMTLKTAKEMRDNHKEFGFSNTVKKFEETCSRSVVSNVIHGGQWSC